eukprot:PhF_6_TR4364/c0_g1_i1/m.5893
MELYTLAIINSKVWTGNTRNPWAEAIGVIGDTIIHVGTTTEVMERVGDGSTRVLDGKGAWMVCPGFTDTHMHLLDAGRRRARISFRGVTTKSQFVSLLADAAKSLPEGAWILGGDWDQKQIEEGWPVREWMDGVTPKHPVYLPRFDGHSAVANTLALTLCGISETTPDPVGGAYERDPSTGLMNGILRECAMGEVARKIPKSSKEMLKVYLKHAVDHLLENGVTSAHSMCTLDEDSLEEIDFLRSVNPQDELKIRLYSGVTFRDIERLKAYMEEHNINETTLQRNDYVRIGLVKGFADGSLGSHTAAMLQPYSDTPGKSGMLLYPDEVIDKGVADAAKHGFQVAVHAIGDGAVRVVLNAFEKTPNLRRPRVEH